MDEFGRMIRLIETSQSQHHITMMCYFSGKNPVSKKKNKLHLLLKCLKKNVAWNRKREADWKMRVPTSQGFAVLCLFAQTQADGQSADLLLFNAAF